MDIDVTDLIPTARDYSASQSEIGSDAGRITWGNAVECATAADPLPTDEHKAAARDFLADFGAWERSEIDGWDANELGALVIQMAAGDIREAQSVGGIDDPAEYERQANAGRISGRLNFYGGRWFFTLDAWPGFDLVPVG